MKTRITLLFLCIAMGFGSTLNAQDKPKAIKYNAFGLGVYPGDEYMFGGNHTTYRKFGVGLSWRVGIKNIQMNRDGYGTVTYENAKNENWLTGKEKSAYSFGGCLTFIVPITKKWPIYIGAGAIRYRVASEVLPSFSNPGDEYYVINTEKTEFKPNFTAGTMIPLGQRVVINLGYDYLPGTVFVGLAISAWDNYEDIEEW